MRTRTLLLVLGAISLAALLSGAATLPSVVPTAGTVGGATPYHLLAQATTNATVIKSSPCQVYSVQLGDVSASGAVFKFYDKATTPTVGTDAVVKSLVIPPNFGGTNPTFPVGIAFLNGCAFAVTLNLLDSDTTAVAANVITINIDWK